MNLKPIYHPPRLTSCHSQAEIAFFHPSQRDLSPKPPQTAPKMSTHAHITMKAAALTALLLVPGAVGQSWRPPVPLGAPTPRFEVTIGQRFSTATSWIPGVKVRVVGSHVMKWCCGAGGAGVLGRLADRTKLGGRHG
jgi:hypothetical protein